MLSPFADLFDEMAEGMRNVYPRERRRQFRRRPRGGGGDGGGSFVVVVVAAGRLRVRPEPKPPAQGTRNGFSPRPVQFNPTLHSANFSNRFSLFFVASANFVFFVFFFGLF